MDAMDAIRTRRSIRAFTDQPVAEETIQELLDAAMCAPSAGNGQPWHFVVIDAKPVLHRIPDIHPYAKMAARAPLAILVCGDVELEKYEGFWVQDCSAATQNLLLAAHALGLGAVWTGIHPVKDRVEAFRKLLKVPKHIVPMALIVLGHHKTTPHREDRYLAERVHRNGW